MTFVARPPSEEGPANPRSGSSGNSIGGGSTDAHPDDSPGTKIIPSPPKVRPNGGNISSERSSGARGAATVKDDDDDDLELSSVSSDDDDDGDDDNNSKKRSALNSKTSHSSLTTSSETITSPPTSFEIKRRQSAATHELLSQATQQQQKLLSSEATDIVKPTPTASSARTSQEHAGVTFVGQQQQVSRSNSVQSLLAGIRSVSTNSNTTPSSYLTQPVKRQSIADIRRALSITASPGETPSGLSLSTATLATTEEAKLGNAKVKRFVTEIRDAINIFRRDTGVGKDDKKTAVGDASFEEIRKARDILEATKVNAVNELRTSARNSPLIVESNDIKKALTALFDELVKEGDRRANAEVIDAMCNCIQSVDFESIVLVRQLYLSVCAEGYPKFLNIFLSMPRVNEALTQAQLSLLLQGAAAHPIYRIDLLTVVFRHGPSSPAGVASLRDMQQQYQDAFEQAVSLSKAGSAEDRTNRLELIKEAIRAPNLINFSSKDGGDKQTIFSRAAREGDLELVTILLQNRKVDDVNRVQPDGTNALQQAAARGHLKVVDVLLKLSIIAPSLTYVYPGRGTALDLALSSKQKNLELIELLKRRAVELRLVNDKPETPESPGLRRDCKGMEPSNTQSAADRRQSRVAMARKKSVAGGKEEEEPLTINGVVDGTNIVKILLTAIKPIYEEMKYEESFDPKGEELRKLGVLKEDLQRAKDNMTLKLSKLEPTCQIEIRKDEVKDDVIIFMDRIIEETSKLGGNVQLFELLVSRMQINFDFATIAAERNWFYTAAWNGSTEFVDTLLALPGIKEANLQSFQTKLMFEGAAAASIFRVDSLINLFKHEDTLNLDYFATILKPVWQEAFQDIAANSKARPQEARGNRIQLLKLMMQHKLVQADAEILSPIDKHSVFSRACAEGDAPLVFYLLNPGSHHLKNPNAVTAENMTALMHAVANGHKNVVEIFVQLLPARPEGKELLAFKVPLQGGNAADVALRKKQTAIAALLKANGITPLTEQA